MLQDKIYIKSYGKLQAKNKFLIKISAREIHKAKRNNPDAIYDLCQNVLEKNIQILKIYHTLRIIRQHFTKRRCLITFNVENITLIREKQTISN